MKTLKGIPSTPRNIIEEKYIAFIFGSNTAVEMLLSIAKTANQRIFAYGPRFTDDQKNEMRRLGIKHSSSITFVKLNLASFKVIVTMGFLPHAAHKPVIEICALYKKLGGKILDFQHGLFQWGVNFTDTSNEQGYEQENGIGISLPIETFADEKICWFGEGGVGYPKARPQKNLDVKSKKYICIISNTNWHIYSNEEKIKFAYLLGRYIKKNDSDEFIWKPHPAEFNRKLSPVFEILTDYKFANLTVVPHGEQSKSASELIGQCKWGIATIGTSILDFYIHQKPCLMYASAASTELIKTLHKYESFSSLKAMRPPSCVPAIKDFKEFDSDKFWSTVKLACNYITYSDSLEYMLDAIRN